MRLVCGSFYIALVLMLVVSPNVRSETLFLINFNTLFESRASQGGTFQTPIVLFKRTKGLTYTDDLGKGPQEITVTPQEFEILQPHLAKHSHDAGRAAPAVAIADGDKKIFAKNYFLRHPDSYRYFSPPAPGQASFLLKDVEKVYQLDPNQNFKGPTWSLVTAALMDPELAGSLAVYSDRSQDRLEFLQALQFAGQRESWAHLPSEKHIYPLGQPEFDRFGEDFKGRIPDFIRHTVYEMIGKVPLHQTPANWRWSSDGQQREYNHLVVIAETDFETWLPTINFLQSLARGKFRPMPFKIVLFNPKGLNSGAPFFGEEISVMTSSGSLRLVRAEERSEFAFLYSSGPSRSTGPAASARKPTKKIKPKGVSATASCRKSARSKGKTS